MNVGQSGVSGVGRAGTLLALSLSSPEFLPRIFFTNGKASLLLFGIGWGLVGGVGLDGVRRAHAAKAEPRNPRHGDLRGAAVGGVALPRGFLDHKQHRIRSNFTGQLPARVGLLRGIAASLQGADGVGLRPHRREYARGDVNAREFLGQHVDPGASGESIGARLDLSTRVGSRVVGRGRSGRRGQPRTSYAAATA
jgi:hypothetical protein